MAPGEQRREVVVPAAEFNLVGHKNFVRHNPKSDHFRMKKFHHTEFWCMDATNTARRFSWGLGMQIVAKSDLSTDNKIHASYVLRSGNLTLVFTAPYAASIAGKNKSGAAIPTFDHDSCQAFVATHGLAVRAVGIEVDDAEVAFSTSVAHGAKPCSPPVTLDNSVVIAEVQLYGDVVLRYLSYKDENNIHQDAGSFLPRFQSMDQSYSSLSFDDLGFTGLDHVASCVPELGPSLTYVKGFTGFHDFAELTTEDIGTADSGANLIVLANNTETVLFPTAEPVSINLKSQVQTFLEHNGGAGVQHLALNTSNIFKTVEGMKKRSGVGGFEFLPPPPPTYYKNLKNRVGDVLTDEQIKQCEELGLLVDKDDQGTLLQIFTKPAGDRATFFMEIIKRIGCMEKDEEGNEYQRGGCGGFGKGNTVAVFKAVEEYSRTLNINQITEEEPVAA